MRKYLQKITYNAKLLRGKYISIITNFSLHYTYMQFISYIFGSGKYIIFFLCAGRTNSPDKYEFECVAPTSSATDFDRK